MSEQNLSWGFSLDEEFIRNGTKNTFLADFMETCLDMHRSGSLGRRWELLQIIWDTDTTTSERNAAKEELLCIMLPIVMGCLLRKMPDHLDPADKEDIIQDAIVALMDSFEKKKATLRSFSASTYIIADIVIGKKCKPSKLKTVPLHDWLQTHSEEELRQITCDDTGDLESEFMQHRLTENVDGALKTLNPREADILRRGFGMYPYHEEQNYRTIAKAYSVIPERIRQIKVRALCKLRHYPRNDYFLDFIELPPDLERERILCLQALEEQNAAEEKVHSCA